MNARWGTSAHILWTSYFHVIHIKRPLQLKPNGKGWQRNVILSYIFSLINKDCCNKNDDYCNAFALCYDLSLLATSGTVVWDHLINVTVALT